MMPPPSTTTSSQDQNQHRREVCHNRRPIFLQIRGRDHDTPTLPTYRRCPVKGWPRPSQSLVEARLKPCRSPAEALSKPG
eukprot:356631-Chlamydomonas_euryale.AAC.2